MRVTRHAIERYLERTGAAGLVPDDYAEDAIRAVVRNGEEVVLSDPGEKLSRKYYKEAKYFRLWGIVAVVVKEMVMTTFVEQAGKFKLREEQDERRGSG